MTDPPPYSDSGRGTGDDVGTTPRWVKVFGIVALIVVLLFVVLMFTRGPHGPRRHMPSGGSSGQTPPSIVVGAPTRPAGGRG